MIGLSHVILHVGLCASMSRAKPETTMAISVRALDRRLNVKFDKTFAVERGDDDNPKIVEFDLPVNIYRLDLSAPKYGCNASGFLALLPDHNRSVDETLAPGPASPGMPLLFAGASPQSFLYVKPTFVLLDNNTTACNKPVGEPIPAQVVVENDQDAYYAYIYSDPSLVARGPMRLALRLNTPTHQYHYVRVPIPFPMPWGGWPNSVTFDVTQDEVDELASQPVNTFLCLHLWETKVYL
jgi:hypothetical protein